MPETQTKINAALHIQDRWHYLYVEDKTTSCTAYKEGHELLKEKVDDPDKLVYMQLEEGRENEWDLPYCFVYYKRPLVNDVIEDHIKQYYRRGVTLSHPISKVNYELKKIARHTSVGRLVVHFGLEKALNRINQLINLHGYDNLQDALEKVLSWQARNELTPPKKAEVEPTEPVRARIAAHATEGRL